MNLETQKIELAQLILGLSNENLISKIKNLITLESNSQVVGYDLDGQAITLKDYNNRLEEGEADYAKGKVSTADEIKADMKNWE